MTASTSTTGPSAVIALHHKGCDGRWRGVVSLGSGPDGKRVRKKVSGKTKTEVKDKLKALHSELSAGVRTSHSYTVEKAVDDWLATGLPGRAEKTLEANRDSLRPLLASIGRMPLADLTAQDVRAALGSMARTHATRTIQKGHNCLTRAIRQAEGQDLVRRNVSALVDTPRGQEGRLSQSLTVDQARALLEEAQQSRLQCVHRAVPVDRNQVRRSAGAHVGAPRPGRWHSVRVAVGPGARGHQDPGLPPDAEAATGRGRGAAEAAGTPGSYERAAAGPQWRENSLVLTTSVGTSSSPTICGETSARSPKRPGSASDGCRKSSGRRSSA